VRAIVDFLEHEAERRHVALGLEVQDGIGPLSVDPDPIQQLVLNLVSNALAATPAGGRVTVAVSVTSDGPRASLQLSVDDTGSGMSPELVQQAFEPFFTTRAGEGGTGLGLSVVRNIVEAHAGTVRLDSEPGRGTHVHIEMPLAELLGDATDAA
jgi:signal transduction histidine kinase